MHRRTFLSVSLAGGAGLALAPLGACAPSGPRAIAYGREQCAFCRMTVDDRRYAAQLATGTGKVHVFDSIECCAAWVAREGAGSVRAAWVSDVSAPGTLVDASAARFWHVPGAVTPMGKGIVATAAAAAPAANAEGPITWAAVQARLAGDAMGRGAAPGAAGHDG